MLGSRMKFYGAPWSKWLVAISVLATLICLGIVVGMPFPRPSFWLRAGLPLLLLIAALFMVRGYTVTPTEIMIHRLGWVTHLPLVNLESVRAAPSCMRFARRLWGNGGLYSFTGLYRTKVLGYFRAFVTDGMRTVVLRFPSKTVVISPDDPNDFVQYVSGFCR